MGVEEPGLGWHSFRRFRKTWLRGKLAQEDINNFWMGHKPRTMSKLYFRLDEELALRFAEAEPMAAGFEMPTAPKRSETSGEFGARIGVAGAVESMSSQGCARSSVGKSVCLLSLPVRRINNLAAVS